MLSSAIHLSPPFGDTNHVHKLWHCNNPDVTKYSLLHRPPSELSYNFKWGAHHEAGAIQISRR